MTTTELLDRAAALAGDGKHIALVAADTRQRELFRRGIQRRLEGLGREWRVTILVPGTMTMGLRGLRLDQVLLGPGLGPTALEWVRDHVNAPVASSTS